MSSVLPSNDTVICVALSSVLDEYAFLLFVLLLLFIRVLSCYIKKLICVFNMCVQSLCVEIHLLRNKLKKKLKIPTQKAVFVWGTT